MFVAERHSRPSGKRRSQVPSDTPHQHGFRATRRPTIGVFRPKPTKDYRNNSQRGTGSVRESFHEQKTFGQVGSNFKWTFIETISATQLGASSDHE